MTTTTTTTTIRSRSVTGLISLAFLAFISLGLPNGLLGVAWPSIRADFVLPLEAMGLLLIASTLGYLSSSFFSGQIVTRLGVGGTLAAACFATGSALIGYTLVPAWWMVMALGVLAGWGGGAIDASLNTYVAANFKARTMQWLHASFGVGMTLGPIIMTSALVLFENWRVGYFTVGTAQIALAVGFGLTVSLWKRPVADISIRKEQALLEYQTPLLETLRESGAWVSIALFFIFTGSQMTLGHWAYTLLVDSRGVSAQAAGLWAGSYWGMFTLGRIMAGVFSGRIGLHRLLQFSLLFSLLGAGLLWWNPLPWVSLFGVVLIGFAAAPIFPGLMTATIERVGVRHTANTIGMQVSAAAIGMSLMPALAGALAASLGLEIIPPYVFGLYALLIGLYLVSWLNRPGSQVE
jgi:fucose permease